MVSKLQWKVCRVTLNSWPSSSSKERLSKAKNNLKAANSQDINTTKVSHFWPPFLFCTQIYINNITEVHVFCISFLIIDNYTLNTYIYLSIYSSTYQIAIIRTCPHLLQNIHVLSHLPIYIRHQKIVKKALWMILKWVVKV